MEPLTAEEKEEYSLDAGTELFWRKDGNIADAKGRMVRKLDMDSEMSREITRKGQKRAIENAKDKIRKLIEEETEFTYEDAPYSLQLAAEAYVTGSSADRKHFLAEARGVGKLADKSKDAAPKKIIVEMDKDVREAMIRGIEIIERGQQRRSLGEATPDSPF